MIHVRTTLGENVTVTVAAETVKEVIQQASFFTELPTKCPLCDSPVHFNFRNPGNFNYYGLRCTGTNPHECNFGAHKEGGTLFYKGKDSWGDEYKSGDGGGGRSEPAPETSSAPAEDDIPF